VDRYISPSCLHLCIKIMCYNASYTCLNLFGKCCRKHKCLSLASLRHCILLYNTSDLWFKAHIQHTVCFIQDQIPEIPNIQYELSSSVALESSHLRFRNLINALGKNTFDELSACRKRVYLYRTTQHRNIKTFMPRVGSEHTIPLTMRPRPTP
jgi:hypothetical protein